jgi:hypothetical protein
MRRAIAALAASLPLLTAVPAAAEPSVQAFLDGYPGEMYQLYLAGLSAGYGWYGSHIGEDGQALAFCQPRDMAFSNDQLMDILRRFSADLPPEVLEYPVGFILLLALEKEYPCAAGSE